jgi:LacI family transcriptional regulator
MILRLLQKYRFGKFSVERFINVTTIKDIANKTGFSVTTVSRALNNYFDVNKETKEYIFKVAEELNYTPNINARRLVTKKSNRIGFIVFGFGKASGEDNFVYELLTGMQQKCIEVGYELVFLMGDIHFLSVEHNTLENIFKRFDLEGIVIMGFNINAPYFNALNNLKLPVVCIDGNIVNEYVGVVSVDNYLASYEATDYLIRQKFRKSIIFLNGKDDSYACSERLRGYKDAVGRELQPDNIFYCNYNDTESYNCIKELINKKVNFDGIFAASDMMAIGALRALNENSYKIGEQVDVIGFDDILISSYINPPLTSVRQNKPLIGEECITLLTDIIEQKEIKRKVIVPHNLVIRKTT